MLVTKALRVSVGLFASCLLLAAQDASVPGPVKRLYIEKFAIKNSNSAVQRQLVDRLRKWAGVSIVASPANADAILTGDGEIWVKGYRSLNPRSGRLPYDGAPIYSGFLSVELKDVKGNTLWSYLVTPAAPSENIGRDLGNSLEKHLLQALESKPVKE